MNARIDIDHYGRKRDLICRTLDECGYEFIPPEGTFYVFPRCPIEEREFIEQAKQDLLLVVPGSDFGRSGYFRISFACSETTVRLACSKLESLAATVMA
jgi:aspartate aminotransferase